MSGLKSGTRLGRPPIPTAIRGVLQALLLSIKKPILPMMILLLMLAFHRTRKVGSQEVYLEVAAFLPQATQQHQTFLIVKTNTKIHRNAVR